MVKHSKASATTNTITYEDVGPVLFEHSKRAKHINISVRPFKGVRVAVPFGRFV